MPRQTPAIPDPHYTAIPRPLRPSVGAEIQMGSQQLLGPAAMQK